MTKEEFIKKAEAEKANFELHKRLIDFHLCDRENKNYSNDLKEFAEKQVVDGNLLLSLMEYAEAYHEELSKLHQPTVISSVCKSEWCKDKAEFDGYCDTCFCNSTN
jgi:hypothetical protein